jgi:acyl carrier protein/acetyltransferase-like isoleucine patch superfamily enzyme
MLGRPAEVLTAEPAGSSGDPVGRDSPATRTEAELAAVLAEVLHVERVPVDGHFFADLGADSMVMAQFCARVRKREDLPSASIKDVYQHPTIRDLAAVLAVPVSALVEPTLDGLLAAVLAEVLHVERVPVDGHFFADLGADSMVMAQFCARVRKREDLPSVSMKDVYQHPTIGSLAAAFPVAVPLPVEGVLAGVLAEVLHVERVPVDGHFFADLGADSMVMAQFCARVRKREDLPSVSMTDVYQHPTVRTLATALAQAAPAPVESSAERRTEVAAPVSTRQYVLCGTLQFLIFVLYSFLAAFVFEQGYEWISAGGGLVNDYLRAVVAGGASFLVACTLPILAKWVLIGRWRPQEIRIWSLAYVRFWMVKTLVASNPLVLFAGSPLFVLYLRALGAKVGRGVVVLSRHMPVCTDLLTIGDGTVIRKDSYLNCYRAHSGVIQTGPVTLGKGVLVGDKSVLDIGTSLGDGAQLGHASSLHAGQAVPGGERWHGSPAQPTQSDYRGVEPADCSSGRRVRYATVQLLTLALVYLPAAFGGVAMLLVEVPWLAALMGEGPLAIMTRSFYSPRWSVPSCSSSAARSSACSSSSLFLACSRSPSSRTRSTACTDSVIRSTGRSRTRPTASSSTRSPATVPMSSTICVAWGTSSLP